MIRLKIVGYTGGLLVTSPGLTMHSYYLRELLASFAYFTVAFFFLALVALAGLLVWHASEQVAIRVPPASRILIALSRRLITADARH